MLLRNDAPDTVIVANDIRQSDSSIHKWGKHNPQQRPWKDPRVRIAFRRGIDYASIAQFLSNRNEFEARGIPVEILTTTHVVNHPSWWLDPEKGELGDLSKNYLFDVAEAKKLTAAAGYDQPIDLPYFVNTTGELPDAEAAVQKSLTDGGVFKVDLRRTPSSEYRVLINVEGQFEGIQQQNGGSNELDYQMFRYYHSSNVGGVPFPDAKLDQLAEAQRREGDFEKRIGIAKEIQLYLAQTFLQNPGRSVFTTFSFRWPWVHNSNYGSYPDRGGHLQWLDENMPNRSNRV
jgi:ABC-type transport system substrate-binding protein